jgi:TRAP-type C4-dicarboxylate transport system substrate-binding protein
MTVARLLAFLPALALYAGASTAQTVEMKLATGAVNESTHEWLKMMAAKMAEKTQGRIAAKVYPASQLGGVPRQIEGILLGQIEMMAAPAAFFATVDPALQVTAAPGVFTSMDHMFHAVTAPEFRDYYLSLGEKKGMKGVSFWVNAPTTFVLRKEVKRLDELKGLKIRVLGSPLQTEPVKRLGATAAPIDVAEVLPSLQNGVIDGALGSTNVWVGGKYIGSAKYVLQVPYSYVGIIGVVSKPWFDKQTPEVQKAIVDSARELEGPIEAWSVASVPQAEKAWQAQGGVIHTLSPEDNRRMQQLTRAGGEDVIKGRAELNDAYSRMLKSVEKTK